MGFPKTLKIECLPANQTAFRYRVLETFTYVSQNGEVVMVPEGFLTDFASVPRFFRFIIPKTGRYNEATVIHDYLCQLANMYRYKRKDADTMFLECMEELGVKKFKRGLMYRGVSVYTFFKRRGKK